MYKIAFSPDSSMIASVGGNNIDLWDVSTGQFLRNLTGYREKNPMRQVGNRLLGKPGVHIVVFSPDGKTIAGASNRDIHLWDRYGISPKTR